MEHSRQEARHMLYGSPRALRREAGKAHRRRVPLEAHAEVPNPENRDDPVATLSAQDVAREPELVPIRHGRMSATPFTFYRGGAAIMGADLAHTPATDIQVQLCGDAHLSNFGIFNGPDRRLVFDLNDFDETLPGPFEWDVKRLVASVTIAARNNELSKKKSRRATRAAVIGYCELMAEVAAKNPLDLHYFRVEVDQLAAQLDAKDRKHADKLLAKASRKNSLRAFGKLTELRGGHRRIVADPPLIVPLEHHAADVELADLRGFFGEYLETLPHELRRLLERYQMVDLAHKVVGVGSVGTRCWIALVTTGDEEPLFLQIKEATASVLEPYAGASEFEQAGQRVVVGQRMLQAAGDIFLGWARRETPEGTSRDYYFRQLWDGKGSADVDGMGPKRLTNYAWHCGGALALAHARSSDPALIDGYVGDGEAFADALVAFAEAYADINDADYAAHQAAIDEGRIEVRRDL